MPRTKGSKYKNINTAKIKYYQYKCQFFKIKERKRTTKKTK